MKEKAELITALSEFVKRKAGTNDGLVCTVDSYDSTTKTCYCIPIGDFADIQQVKVCPDTGTGLFIQPTVGSKVLVSFMSDSSAYISMFSTYDLMKIGGDSFGGLGKTASIASQVNNGENKINALITAITGWTPVPNDGGAALKVALTTWLASSLVLTTQADISSTVTKHGNGTT
jgi:hypothetical protein